MANKDEIPTVQYNQKDTDPLVNAWWVEPKGECYSHIIGKVKRIREYQRQRRIDWLRFARLYTNSEFDQFINGVVSGYFGRRLSFNVCRSTVDTACAKISKGKPRPLFLTENGDYKQQNRAQKLTQYTDGQFYDLKMWKIGKKVFRDACIFGTGAMKFFVLDGKVQCERVFIDEIVVDELDARSQKPREMHQMKVVDKVLLLHMFPDKQKEILTASLDWNVPRTNRSTANVIGVVESWHLPSGPNAKDGRHTISVENASLLDEPYEKDYFPFTFFRWNDPLMGFYGEGLVSQLVGIQLEINNVLMRIKDGLELVAIPRVLVEESSGVSAASITDEVGSMVKYRGTKPEFFSAKAFEREVYDYLEYLYKKAYEDTGISQLSASSKKPAGLDSGVALREYQDIETERFSIVAEAYQDLYLDAAKIMIDLQKDLSKDAKEQDNKVKVKVGDFIKTIKWKEVNLDDDKFLMQPYPTNFLPKTPEGQLQFTQELVQSGYIEPEEAMSLLNFPDLKGFFNLKTAAIDDIKFVMEQMIEEGVYTPPEQYMNLDMAIKMTQSAYLRGKTNGTPQDRLDLLSRFIDECQTLLGAANPPPSPPSLGVPGATPGATAVPAPSPTSDLIPQTGVQ